MEHVIACTPTKLNHILGEPKVKGIEVPCVKCGDMVWLSDSSVIAVKEYSQETPTVMCIPCVAERIEADGGAVISPPSNEQIDEIKGLL